MYLMSLLHRYNSRSRSSDGGEPHGEWDSGPVSSPVHLTQLNSAKVDEMVCEEGGLSNSEDFKSWK